MFSSMMFVRSSSSSTTTRATLRGMLMPARSASFSMSHRPAPAPSQSATAFLTGRRRPMSSSSPLSSAATASFRIHNNRVCQRFSQQHVPMLRQQQQQQQRRQMSFWGDFVKKVKEETSKNKELSESLEELSQKTKQVAESESVKQARDRLSQAAEVAQKSVESSKEALGKVAGKAAETVGKGASEVGKQTGKVGETFSSASEQVSKSEVGQAASQAAGAAKSFFEQMSQLGKGITNSVSSSLKQAQEEAVKAVASVKEQAEGVVKDFTAPTEEGAKPKQESAEASNDNGEVQTDAAASGDATDGETQRQQQQQQKDEVSEGGGEEEKEAVQPEAGAQLVARELTVWEKFKEQAQNTAAFQSVAGFKASMEDSDNPAIQKALDVGGGVTGAVGSLTHALFGDSEVAHVIKHVKAFDPNFSLYGFMEDLEESKAQELLEAYFKSDREFLENRCTKKAYSMFDTLMKQREIHELFIDSRILDLHEVELHTAAFIEQDGEDQAVMVVTFKAHQVNCVRDRFGDVVEGADDEIQNVHYLWGLTFDEEIGQFKLSEMVLMASQGTW